MTEIPGFSGEHERTPQFEVDPQTAKALYYYIEDNEVGLSRAAEDLVNLGMFVHGTKLGGGHLDVEYPAGQAEYEEREIPDEMKGVKRISIYMTPELQKVITTIAEELGITSDMAFAALVNEGHGLRVDHRRGGVITRVDADGKRTGVTLPSEKIE